MLMRKNEIDIEFAIAGAVEMGLKQERRYVGLQLIAVVSGYLHCRSFKVSKPVCFKQFFNSLSFLCDSSVFG